jgi:hypothetical protein
MVRAGSAGAAIDGDPVSIENGERREGEWNKRAMSQRTTR